MGINFIAVLPRTMEDPDVITRAQLALAICGRRNCRTGKHGKKKKEQPRAVEKVGTLGFICIVAVTLCTHRIPRGARYYRRIFWTSANRWKNMQRTRSTVIGGANARLLRANVVRSCIPLISYIGQ